MILKYRIRSRYAPAFGKIDEKKGSYKNYMSVYINIARDAGAIPDIGNLGEQT